MPVRLAAPRGAPREHRAVGCSRAGQNGDVGTPDQDLQSSRVVILGGGPGGYESALVARRLGADVTVVERLGLGGSAVLTDVVPSKTLIATAEWMSIADRAPDLGIHLDAPVATHQRIDRTRAIRESEQQRVDLGEVNARVKALEPRAHVRRLRGSSARASAW